MTGSKDYFGRWLDRTLDNTGIQGAELARHLNVSAPVVSKWRNGKQRPSMKLIKEIADLLDVDPLELAVTAGHLDPDIAGKEPLPIPEDREKRKRVLLQVGQIKGLTQQEKQLAAAAIDRIITGGRL